jgi:hypothetical protein
LGIIHRKPSPTPENTPDLVDDDLVVLNEQPAQIDNKHTMADKKPVNINKYSNPAAKKRTQDLSREEMMVLLDYYRVSSHPIEYMLDLTNWITYRTRRQRPLLLSSKS